MHNWDLNLGEMKEKLAKARKEKHTRLFCLAYEPRTVSWCHKKDEAEMQKFLDSRDRSESIFFNCAVAIVVVNPIDSDETIHAILASKAPRIGTGPGYFREAF